MSDREQFEAARAAGLKARHETRVERAIRRESAEHLEALAQQWVEIGLIWDIGPAEQRGTPAQVVAARENASALRCWATHQRQAEMLLNPPDIGAKETS